MRKFTVLTLFTCLSSITSVFAVPSTAYHVADADIYKGYITEKVWLSQYAIPQIQINDITYKAGVTLPANALPSDPHKLQVVLGLDRKRPFAFVSIPAYTTDPASKEIRQVSGFTLTIDEQILVTSMSEKAGRNTGVTNSVLANGTWYKIAVSSTGLYKIDYNFLNSMGIDPSSIHIANFRVFGNGGNMLSEDNAVPRKNDLAENAIWAYDANGNGVFDKEDYVVFYAVGPLEWDKDSLNQSFTHQTNIYENNAYYFLTFDQGAGLRVQDQGSVPVGNETITDFNAYMLHEQELVNLGPFGREWLGEQFSNNPGQQLSQSFNFNLGPTTSAVDFKIAVATQSSSGGDVFNFSLNGQPAFGSLAFGISNTGSSASIYLEQLQESKLNVTGNAAININYQPTNSTGYLDFIEVNYRRALTLTDNQMTFRDWNSVGMGKIATYQIQSAAGGIQVWDVTNPQIPVKMKGTLSSSTYSFTQDAQELHEFVAMNNTNLSTPTYIEQVSNQNLHGPGQVDFIIVAYPGFLNAANSLADYHRQTDNMRVIVATTAQVYNEFSSGSQDISAIRDFAKMFYDRAGTDTSQMPKYLLLFGGASYDYKNRITNNTDFVPTYESPLSNDPINSLASDDFFAILDDNENIENPSLINAMDIGVGRFPVATDEEAISVVNKLENYKSPSSLGPWRLSSTLVADNEDDAGTHMADEELAGSTINSSTDLYNYTKVYEDALPFVSTPGGERCPQANQDIDGQVFKGTFLLNYTGHGNTEVWSSERILTQADYDNWNNINALPFVITATCDFGQFDNPAYVSAGQALAIRNNGGVIAALTTTQESYESGNVAIDTKYLNAQFTPTNNGWNTFGEALRKGKNAVIFSPGGADISNLRKFVLFGDPALTPDFPAHSISIDSVKDAATLLPTSTVSALGSYVIYGSVTDGSGTLLNNFNGLLSVTIYDKPVTFDVITKATGRNAQFQVQDNIVYRGKVSVTNGHYSYTFVAPKDINYEFGKGKISSYAQSDVTDAAGSDTTLAVGGFSDNPVLNNTPPIVKPYIGDSLFINGGITGRNTSLFVELFSKTGINVTGNGAGHDLTAVLDDNTQQPYVLNDYYETLPNTYQQGYVNFPITGLADGRHSITVRAWDVNDNLGEGTVDFQVVDGQVVEVQNLMNYPNPFRDLTHFVFEHNHPNEQLDAQINIYNISGILVRTLNQSFMPTGSRTNQLDWDGTDNSGAKLPSGVYVYRLNLSTQNGIQSSAYQKLVISR